MPNQPLAETANKLRKALITARVVSSPSYQLDLKDIPKERQQRWLSLAALYNDLFATYTRVNAARYLITIPSSNEDDEPIQVRQPLIGHTAYILYTEPHLSNPSEMLPIMLQNWVRNAGNHIWTRSTP